MAVQASLLVHILQKPCKSHDLILLCDWWHIRLEEVNVFVLDRFKKLGLAARKRNTCDISVGAPPIGRGSVMYWQRGNDRFM
jgi:hypothetical protein